MRKSITWTPQAEEDAYETYRHIALDSIDAAEAYFDALFAKFNSKSGSRVRRNPMAHPENCSI